MPYCLCLIFYFLLPVFSCLGHVGTYFLIFILSFLHTYTPLFYVGFLKKLPVFLVFFCDHIRSLFFFFPLVDRINICYGLIDLLILHGLDIYLLGTGGWGRVSGG